jgi:hypothetical protein
MAYWEDRYSSSMKRVGYCSSMLQDGAVEAGQLVIVKGCKHVGTASASASATNDMSSGDGSQEMRRADAQMNQG